MNSFWDVLLNDVMLAEVASSLNEKRPLLI